MKTELVTMIGLEAECFVSDKKGDLVIAGEKGLPCDDFELLAEIRGEPGKTWQEAIINFNTALLEMKFKASAKDLTLTIVDGMTIPHSLYAKVMKLMGSKEWPECKNIHNTDISEISDNNLDKETGKIVSHNVSAGLHIHFSKQLVITDEVVVRDPSTYYPIQIPLSMGEIKTNITFYQRAGGTEEPSKPKTSTVIHKQNMLSMADLKHIIEFLDLKILSKYPCMKTKYRQPGFYEIKPWGFEYRSLPFNNDVLNGLDFIAKYAFELLEDLKIK